MNKSNAIASALLASLSGVIREREAISLKLPVRAYVLPDSDPTPPSKGKRSKRRRAAKMRAAGFIHKPYWGWVEPEIYKTLKHL